MIVDELEIGEATLDPDWNARQYLVSVLVAITDHHTGDYGRPMRVLVFNLSRGDIEILMKCREQGF